MKQIISNKRLMRELRPSGIMVRLSKDTDKDGFVNAIDCAPYNKNRDGLGDWIKSKYHEAKERITEPFSKEEIEHRKQVRQIETKSRREEELKAAEEIGKERAKARYKTEVRRLHQRKKPFMQTMAKGIGGTAKGISEGLGYSRPKRKSKSGVKYVMVQNIKKNKAKRKRHSKERNYFDLRL